MLFFGALEEGQFLSPFVLPGGLLLLFSRVQHQDLVEVKKAAKKAKIVANSSW